MGLLAAAEAQTFAAGPPQTAQAPFGAGSRLHPGWPPASSAEPQPNGRRAPFQRQGPHPGRNHPGGIQLRSPRLRPLQWKPTIYFPEYRAVLPLACNV